MSEPEVSANPDVAGADEHGKMSFFDHLTELRNRIVWSLIPRPSDSASRCTSPPR